MAEDRPCLFKGMDEDRPKLALPLQLLAVKLTCLCMPNVGNMATTVNTWRKGMQISMKPQTSSRIVMNLIKINDFLAGGAPYAGGCNACINMSSIEDYSCIAGKNIASDILLWSI